MNTKAKKPKSVLDLDKWLPSYGENKVSLFFLNSNLKMEILYDSNVSGIENKLIIVFKHACFYSMASFPGVDMGNIDYEKSGLISDLVEYEKSDAADKWSYQLSFSDRIKHYIIYFLSENQRVEIFADGFTVTHEE